MHLTKQRVEIFHAKKLFQLVLWKLCSCISVDRMSVIEHFSAKIGQLR